MTQVRLIRARLDDLPTPHPEVLQLLEAWKLARSGRLIPMKRDFDPLSVPSLLRKIWLYGLKPDGSDFVCRLAGEDINRTWKGSIAGRAAKSLFGPADHRVIVDIWHTVLETPLIHYGKAEKMTENSPYAAERIVLPLASGPADPAPGYVLGMSLYEMGDLSKAQPEHILANAFHVYCSDID